MAGKPHQTPTKKEQGSNPLWRVGLGVVGIVIGLILANRNGRWYAALERPEWWLVFIAAITGWAIYRQGREMARTTKVMWLGQRPQLTLNPHENPVKDLMGDIPRIQLELVNCGMTAAHNVTYETWIETLAFPFRDFSETATYFHQTSKTVLYPSHVPLVINLPLQRAWKQGEKEAIKAVQLFVCFRVRVEFSDGQNPHRHTDFGMYVKREGFGYLPKYNETN